MTSLTPQEFPKSSLFRLTLGDERFARFLTYISPIGLAQGDTLDSSESTYLVLSGSFRVEHDGVAVARLERGDIFGGLARSKSHSQETIVVLEPSRVGCLSAGSWFRMSEEEPQFAVDALRALMSRKGGRSAAPLDGQGILLRLPPRAGFIDVKACGAPHCVASGTLAQDMLPERVSDRLVVAALLDRKAVSLTTPITSVCELEALTTESLEGQRFFRQSQALLLLEAAYQVDSDLRLRLSHSLGFAQRVEVASLNEWRLDMLVEAIDAKMKDLVAEDVKLVEVWSSTSEAREIFEARGWADAAKQLVVRRTALVKLVGYGELLVTSPGPLVPSTRLIGRARLVADGEALLLIYGKEGGRAFAMSTEFGLPQPMAATGRFAAISAFRQTDEPFREQRRWLSAVGISSVGEFNQVCIKGDVSEIIRVSEGLQEKRIGTIADQITSCGPALKVVAVAGPSSSGKTTFISRLKVQLQVNGLTPVELSLDNYYCNREETPLDANGEYDYESVGALQVSLLSEHLGRIIVGDEVQTPLYDFQRGLSLLDQGPRIRLKASDVLVLEGIHGLNPIILNAIPDAAAFRIFICPLTQLPFDPLTRVHVSDVRLLRRIVRDRHARSAPAADTIMRWPSVRSGERLNIFPFQEYADSVFDSSLIYEIAVLKVYAERYLLEVPAGHPAYTTAHRLLHLIGRFVAIYPDHVPPNSLLREFIGGSSFSG